MYICIYIHVYMYLYVLYYMYKHNEYQRAVNKHTEYQRAEDVLVLTKASPCADMRLSGKGNSNPHGARPVH